MFSIITRNKLRTSLLIGFLSIFVLYNLLKFEENKTSKYDENPSEKTAILIPINATVNLSSATNYNRINTSPVLLLVDVDCLQKISSNLECRIPINIAVFQTNNTSVSNRRDFADESSQMSSWLNFEYSVTNATDTDYWLFTGMHPENAQNGTAKNYAVKRFEIIRTVLPVDGRTDGYSSLVIHLPSEVSKFIRNWQNRNPFLDCEHALTRPAATESKRLIPLGFAKRIAEFMEFAEKYNATPFLMGGTLLGWRRECSIIPHTTDVDIGILREQHNLELLRALIASPTFSVSNMNGHMNSTFMMALWVDGIKIDFDYVFTNADGKAYVAGFRGNRQVLRWVYPRIQQICAGDLLGHLVHVPCNVDEILEADYGPDWRIDHPTSNFRWDKSHKNRESGEILSQEEWDRIMVATAGQNTKNETVVDDWLKRVGAI